MDVILVGLGFAICILGLALCCFWLANKVEELEARIDTIARNTQQRSMAHPMSTAEKLEAISRTARHGKYSIPGDGNDDA